MNRFRKLAESQKEDKTEASEPMRPYTDEALPVSPSMINFRLEITAYWLVPLVLFLAILIGGIYVAYKFNVFGESGSEAEQQYAYYDASGQIMIPELLDSYLTALGGRTALEGIRSVRYKGRLLESEIEMPFQVLLSVPDKGMVITTPGEDYSQRLLYNGGIAWRVVVLRDGSRRIIGLGEKDTALLAWSLRFHNSFRAMVLSDRQAYQGFSARETSYRGKPSIELTKVMPDGSDFLVVLEKDTLHLLMMEESAPTADGTGRVQAIYKDYRMVSGVLFSHETKLYKNGELYNETMLESVEINPGLLSSLFAIPEELSE